jgi:hypothetical protein
VDAVAARLAADVEDRVAHTLGPAEEDAVRPRHPDGHGVDEDVAVVTRVEGHVAADRGHADAVAVAADAVDDAFDQVRGLRVVRPAEAQRIQQRDGPGAHGEHVPQDAAHARRRALLGLDVRRMVVALHLEHDDPAVADVDHAGVLARAEDDVRPRRRQPAQMHAAGLVRAVLAPQHAEYAQLGPGRRASERALDAGVLVLREAVTFDHLG